MNIKTTLSILLLAMSTTAPADAFGATPIPLSKEWMATGSTPNSDMYVRPSSIRRAGDVVTLWAATVSKRGSAFLPSYVVYKAVLNCAEETAGSTDLQAYTRDGAVFGLMDTTPVVMEPIMPDTFNESLYNKLCKPQD